MIFSMRSGSMTINIIFEPTMINPKRGLRLWYDLIKRLIISDQGSGGVYNFVMNPRICSIPLSPPMAD